MLDSDVEMSNISAVSQLIYGSLAQIKMDKRTKINNANENRVQMGANTISSTKKLGQRLNVTASTGERPIWKN